MKPDESAVRDALDSIKDPCSISVGAPLGLIEMGLVTGVRVGDDGHVAVDIRLTSPGCMMGILYFDSEIKRRLGAMAGVTSVEVGRTHDLSWSEDDISAHGQELLREVRMKRLRELPVVANTPTAT
jgi:metal-sulfur cluster biosynthetic enzyme